MEGHHGETRTMTIAEALREAIREEMRRDERVFCLGEDIGIVEVVPPGEFLGKSLKELKIPSRFNCQVIGLKTCAVKDAVNENEREATTKFTPSADDVITERTVMILIGKLDDIERIQVLSKR